MSDTPVQETNVQESTEKPSMGEALYGSETPTAAPEAQASPPEVEEPSSPSAPPTGEEAKIVIPPVEAKAPEGAAVNSDFLEGLTNEAAERGWDQATVDKMVEMNIAEMDGYDDASRMHWQDQCSAWDKECLSDPDMKDYDNVVAPVFEAFSNTDDLKILNESGVLKIPALKRIFAKIGKARAEDTVSGSANGEATTTAPTDLRAIYDHETSRSTG